MNGIDEFALFEALNAKRLEPAEIVASFVIPPQYDRLVGPDHAIVIGPRGSGKTTLLRMLQGQTLTLWDHRRAPQYRKRVRYSSVFLPADRVWASQVASVGPAGLDLGFAAFSTQLLYALVETMLYRVQNFDDERQVHYGVSLRHQLEVELVRDCAEAWRLRPRSPSLEGLQTSLDLRLSRMAELLEVQATAGRREQGVDEGWFLSPLEAFAFGIRAFNRYAQQPGHRWALLLDEMELAPPRVHQALYGQLRGGEKSLILKLSFSPVDRNFGSSRDAAQPAPEHDFRPIYLWYGTRVGGRGFTRGLWTRMMRELYQESKSPLTVLGESEFDTSTRRWRQKGTAYQTGSPQQRLIASMYHRDPTFRQYLTSAAINPDALESVDYRRRSSTLRKVYPLLVFRNALLDFHDGRIVPRPRKKTLEPFTGSEAVSAALEGNPRWIKAVFSRLLGVYDGEKVPRGFQYDVLTETAERFESLLRVLPPEGGVVSETVSVLDLLDGVIRFFRERNLGPFKADAPSTFVVDRIPERYEALLRTALAAGAVVHLRSKNSPSVLKGLRGERFRLAYLLTIRDGHELPLRIGKSVQFSRIIEWLEPSTAQGHGDGPQQLTLESRK